MFLVLVATAGATVPDLFGAGARSQGSGGGGVSVVDDGNAALVNPAGLAMVRRPTMSLGVLGGFFTFEDVPDLWWDTNRDGSVDTRDDPLVYEVPADPATGLQLQMARHVGSKVGVGMTAYVPARGLIRFSTFEPDLPAYFMYENRPHRYVMAVGAGGQLWNTGLSLGVGVDVLAKARIHVQLELDAAVSGPEEGDEDAADLIDEIVLDVHQLEVQLVPAYAPVVGLRWDAGKVVPALDGLQLGASFHAAVGLRIDANIDIQANVSAEDIGEMEPYVTAIIMGTKLNLADHYTPARFVAGASYKRGETLLLYVDSRWTDWRRMLINVTHVESTTLEAPFVQIPDDTVADGNEFDATLVSVWGVRTGIELTLPTWEKERKKIRYLKLTVRGGFGYEPTPLAAQGDSALLDADRLLFTLGFGTEHWDPFGLVDGPITYDMFGQFHTLTQGVLARDSGEEAVAGYPVDFVGIPIGGTIFVVGAQFGFEY